MAAAPAPASLSATVEAVERFAEGVRALREGLDRTNYDIDALSFELAFEDADAIVERVHEDLDYEPYRGTLRGAAGTVATGAGNALDLALVTARLLGDAGYEAEIRRGRLGDDAARAVLAQVRTETEAGRTVALDPAQALPGLTEEGLAQVRDEAQRSAAEMLRDTDAAEDRLLQHVDFEDGFADELVDVARDYFWVAYRWSEGEPWQGAHPVFGDTPEAFADLTVEEAFTAEIPADLQHRVRVQMFLERKLGDSLDVEPITASWERPAANLYGVARTFAIMPDGLEAVDDPEDVDALTDATQFFFPIVEGDLAEGAMAFDLRGNVVPPDAAASPMAGVFGEVNEGFGEAAGALGALGGDAPAEEAQALTAVWLEIVGIDPGGAETTHRRMIVDRIGAGARQAARATLDEGASEREAVAALVGAHTFMLDTGVYREGYVLDRSFAAFEATSDYLDRVVAAMAAGERPPAYGGEAAEAEEALGPLHLFHAFDALEGPPDVRLYRPAPGIVIMSQDVRGRAQVDVVANPRLALRIDRNGPVLEPEANLRAGVWETRTEVLPLGRAAEVVSPSFRALDGGDLVAVRDARAAARLGLSAESAAAVREDLERGYLVLAPAAGFAPDEVAGWWRVDPRTGETLGRGGDGRGQSFTEYLTSFEVSVSLTAGFTIYGVHECTKIEDPTVAGCCIIQNVAMAAVGVGVGTAAGLALNTAENLGAAIRLFAALDLGTNLLATQAPTLCPV